MPAGNVLSQTDGLGNVTTTRYNNLEQQVSTVPRARSCRSLRATAAFNNLPQTPGVPRTFTVYVQASSAPSDGSDYSISESGSASPALVTSISATTPLGEGWYELGTITLGESDTSSTLTVHYSGSGVTNVCLVQPMSAETYTPTGLVASQTNGNGGVTNFTYDALGNQTSESDPAPDPTAPTVRPVTSDVYDALGRVTAETDPLGARRRRTPTPPVKCTTPQPTRISPATRWPPGKARRSPRIPPPPIRRKPGLSVTCRLVMTSPAAPP